MRKEIIISLAVLLAVFLAIGCTDTGTDEGTDEAVVPPAEEDTVVPPTDEEPTDQPITDEEQQLDDEIVETTEVIVDEDGFNPETIRVMLGDTVTWTNTGQEDVTITSDDDFFNSGILGPGETFSYTFDVAGTFDYSSEEDFMTSGTVIVEPGMEDGTEVDDQTVTQTTVPTDDETNITAEDRGFETTGEGDIIVESDQPATNTTITPDEEDNDTL
jgi:plastocyanin